MGHPVLVARLRIINGGGTFDSLSAGRIQPRITWSTSASLANEPNSCTVGIYNLAPETIAKCRGVVTVRQEWTPEERAQLFAAGASAEPFEQTTDTLGLGQVELSWGFADSQALALEPRETIEAALSIGFSGQIIRGPFVSRSDNDRIMTMVCQDGGETLGAAEAVQEAGSSSAANFEGKSYEAGTRTSAIVADMARAIGLGVSESNEAKIDAQIIAALAAKGLPQADATTSSGRNISGPIRPQLERILTTSLGLRWTIYNGELFIFAPGESLPGFAPLVLSRARSNILGEIEDDADSVTVTTQATTAAIPGREVNISAGEVTASGPVDQSATKADTDSGGTTTIKLQRFTSLVDSL